MIPTTPRPRDVATMPATVNVDRKAMFKFPVDKLSTKNAMAKDKPMPPRADFTSSRCVTNHAQAYLQQFHYWRQNPLTC